MGGKHRKDTQACSSDSEATDRPGRLPYADIDEKELDGGESDSEWFEEETDFEDDGDYSVFFDSSDRTGYPSVEKVLGRAKGKKGKQHRKDPFADSDDATGTDSSDQGRGEWIDNYLPGRPQPAEEGCATDSDSGDTDVPCKKPRGCRMGGPSAVAAAKPCVHRLVKWHEEYVAATAAIQKVMRRRGARDGRFKEMGDLHGALADKLRKYVARVESYQHEAGRLGSLVRSLKKVLALHGRLSQPLETLLEDEGRKGNRLAQRFDRLLDVGENRVYGLEKDLLA